VTLDSPTATDWTGVLAEIATSTLIGADGFRLDDAVVPLPEQRGHGRRQLLIASLTHALYQRFYHHHATPELHRDTSDTVDRRPASARGDAAFCARLTAALGERSYWEDGWRVLGPAGDGRTLVVRDDLVLHVEDDELRRTADGGAGVRFPADRPWASTGYHVVTGLAGPGTRATGLARCYLHLQPATAPEVFARIVAGLDAIELPFTAKVLNDPLTYGRPDSAVVYVAREHLPAVVRIAVAERCRASSSFGRSVPAFTRTVLPGVAVADDPGPGVSFGQHRCCAIATGLVDAGPWATRAEKLASMEAALRAEGLDLAALHLNPGHADFELGAS
jgi:hypothetical protein